MVSLQPFSSFNQTFNSQEINIFPNPTDGSKIYFFINNLESYSKVKILFFDFQGNFIQYLDLTANEEGIIREEISNSVSLNKGMYILSINTINSTYSYKLIVN